jgi:hypothetical protein
VLAVNLLPILLTDAAEPQIADSGVDHEGNRAKRNFMIAVRDHNQRRSLCTKILGMSRVSATPPCSSLKETMEPCRNVARTGNADILRTVRTAVTKRTA